MLENEIGVIDEPLEKALSDRYLAYALSTITQRALPDVRDGLKPVHRRILYAMLQLKLDPKSGYKKCARVVGETIGRFHPHGEQSIYDALVRLAQEFAQRYPLVDGQGNFGNIDGDSAAAMRYTEARLTEIAEELVKGIDQDAIDFRQTYDGEDEEPIVFPAAIPNLLANGTNGIAVGMATNIPPHNLSEICDAALCLIKNPEAKTEELLAHIKGPDFPTGGILIDHPEGFYEAYNTGRGSFRLRAKWTVEEGSRNCWSIVITEVPYQVQKAKLIEKIAELMEKKKLPLLGDIRDESAEDVRLILEPKNRSIQPDLLMESMFSMTDLEVRTSMNMNVLDRYGTPKVMKLSEVLQAFLNHRREVLQRRSKQRIDKITSRLEILGGYLTVYLNLDEVIRIIREEDSPKTSLMEKFLLTEPQAEAVLNMRLRSLRKLEEIAIRKERDALNIELDKLKALLLSEKKQWKKISQEIREVQKNFSLSTELGRRRTEIRTVSIPQNFDIESLSIVKEDVTVLLSEKGWIRVLKGHVEDLEKIKFKEGDHAAFIIYLETTDKILMTTTDGKSYTLSVNKLPGGRGQGEPIRVIVDIGDGAEPLSFCKYNSEGMLFVISSSGRGFFVKEQDLIASTRNGKQVMNLATEERMILCRAVIGDMIAIISDLRKLLIFSKEEVPIMSRGKGVKLQKVLKGSIRDAITFSKELGLQYTDTSGRNVQVKTWKDYIGKRAQAGRMVEKGIFPRSGYFIPKS